MLKGKEKALELGYAFLGIPSTQLLYFRIIKEPV